MDSDRARLKKLLDELAGGVEELLLAGTTAAGASTQQKIAVAFQEASRARLLRLGSTLRILLEELKKLEGDGGGFSAERLSFFADRAWILARGLSDAIERGDDAAWQRLTFVPKTTPVERLEVVTLGVVMRHVPGAFVAFDLRLRATQAAGPIADGAPLSWSCVFPLKAGSPLPPEAFLALDQKQKFRPGQFLEHKRVVIHRCAIAEGAPMRVQLGDASAVELGDPFDEWARFASWDRAAARERLRAHRPDPLELPVELAEEVVLREWSLGALAAVEGKSHREGELTAEGLTFRARIEAEHVEHALSRANGAPLYGLVHYELCEMVLTPLALMPDDGAPQYITISTAKIDKGALVRALAIR